MRVELFGFQEEAILLLRAKVLMAREQASSRNPQAISFSVPTDSGKTVMMAALFEDILFGAAGFPAQPMCVHRGCSRNASRSTIQRWRRSPRCRCWRRRPARGCAWSRLGALTARPSRSSGSGRF